MPHLVLPKGSLERASLDLFGEIRTSHTELIADRAAFADPEKAHATAQTLIPALRDAGAPDTLELALAEIVH